MGQNPDLLFLSRQFESLDLPKEKRYLLRYFDTPLQTAFLKYVLVFGDYANFVDHTGLVCQPRWMASLYNKLTQLEALHREARANMDMTLLATIESGKYKLCGK